MASKRDSSSATSGGERRPVSAKIEKSKVTRKIKSHPIGTTELPNKFNMSWPKICLFGDSITRYGFNVNEGCWASMLQDKVGDYFDVDLRGFPGYNSRWCLELMPKLFPEHYLNQVEIFVVFIGHNDSWESPCPLHVPIEEYEENMNSIVHYLLENGLDKNKLILITPTWFHEESFHRFQRNSGSPLINKGFDHAARYADVVKHIASREQVTHFDSFVMSHKHDSLETLFCDGLHLSVEGAKWLFKNIWPLIDRKITDSYKKSSNQLFHAVPWDEIPSVKEYLDSHSKSLKANESN